jgi:hypothetical protein
MSSIVAGPTPNSIACRCTGKGGIAGSSADFTRHLTKTKL